MELEMEMDMDLGMSVKKGDKYLIINADRS